MKKILLSSVVFLIFTGCVPPGGELETPDVEATPHNQGAELMLSWDPVPDAEQYVIIYNDEEDTITETSYVITEPATTVQVIAIAEGFKDSEPWEEDYTAVVSTIEVYPVTDPDPEHPSGFGFNVHGEASTYPVSDKSTWPDIDYYIADDGTNYILAAPVDHLPEPINNEYNASHEEEAISFDDLDIAAGPGVYSTQNPLSTNALFSLWLTDNTEYDLSDHYGKLQVQGISGTKISLRVAYQKTPGLRWVKTQ